MPHEAEPQLLARPYRPVVGPTTRCWIAGEPKRFGRRGESSDFVGEEMDVGVVPLAVDEGGRELVGEAEDGEPAKRG